MAFRLKVQEEAIEDIRKAYLWYEKQRLGLGDELIEEIEFTYDEICEHPQYYGFINEKFRRIKVDRFPYRVIYEIENDLIIVNSFDHIKQDRNY